MRDMLWSAVRAKVPEGQILPWWALAVRAVMFPLDFFYWHMSKTRGYQWQSDEWLINGIRYSAVGLHLLSKAKGETFRVWSNGETITIERVHNVELNGERSESARTQG